MGGGGTLHLSAGTYIFNSLALKGGAPLVVESGPVIIKLAGEGVANSNAVLDFSGGAIVNAGMDPAQVQVQYAGTAMILLSGGSQSSGLIYAPNARVSQTGGSPWFGAIIAGTNDNGGGGALHYDRHLASSFVTLGNYMLSSFTWKKY